MLCIIYHIIDINTITLNTNIRILCKVIFIDTECQRIKILITTKIKQLKQFKLSIFDERELNDGEFKPMYGR